MDRGIFMSNQSSRILLLSMFFSIAITNFAVEVNQNNTQKTNKVYSIGTGVSLNFTKSNLGFVVDSYHLFHSQSQPFDKVFMKLGLGVSYEFNPPIGQTSTGFTLVTSLGYLYIQNQYHQSSLLKQFGAGFTVDYTMINTTSHGIGISVYLLLNNLLLGLGGGAIISSDGAQPYVMSSFGVTF